MLWLLALLTIICTLYYHRASLIVWTIAIATFLGLLTGLSYTAHWLLGVYWALFLVMFTPLVIPQFRRKLISQPVLNFYRKVMPSMSRTEREALAAGTVSWEGDLFKGNPNWNTLLSYPKPELSLEEQHFLNGPVETLCSMLDDWDITHNRGDLPPEVWEYMKQEGFFSLIIPKSYGGKEFSAFAHSQILIKIYGRSATAATSVAVPNSLGPAELLLHYGTEEQKNYYLPRLAKGIEIPCFALTGPEAGSDAGSMTDTGIVCWSEHAGEKVLGIRLNFNKRYITLAPIATVIGLAFKMYDPDHLLGNKEELGITCALIPRETLGITIGRRHFPANIVFQNGPIQGKDVFIPLSWIIGGPKMAGQGWRMLMECLAAGRAISLPASAMGGMKVLSYTTGAYARIRHQFNVPIGRFEGIEEGLARIAGYSYIMDATRSFTAGMIDLGAKPAIASAITKYHVTELGRAACIDAMDIHGGKGISLGPKNYLVRFYESIPISITVEGANILTRCLIIFGQGVMRCHPYVFAEFEAARQTSDKDALVQFDKAFIGHLSFSISNFVRTALLSLTSGRIAQTPGGKVKRYFQHATRFSSAFALLADTSVLVLGGSLKRKENISARLGDILSYLYLISATLKQYCDQGKSAEDLLIVEWACQFCFYQIQERFDSILRNFPNPILASILRALIFPWGQRFAKPSDKLSHKVAQLLLSPTDTRARLAEGAFITPGDNNVVADLEDALHKSIAAEPIEKTIKLAIQNREIHAGLPEDQAKSAYAKQIISKEQLDIVLNAIEARRKVIAVDDFSSEDLMRKVENKAVNDKNREQSTSF